MKLICTNERSEGGQFRPNYMEEVTPIRVEKIRGNSYYVLKEYQFDEDGDECGFMTKFFREPLDTKAIAEEFTEVIEKIEELEPVLT